MTWRELERSRPAVALREQEEVEEEELGETLAGGARLLGADASPLRGTWVPPMYLLSSHIFW